MIDPTLPLIDLHRHLDGNVRLQTILELADAHGIDLPARTVEALRPFVVIEDRASDLMDFIGRFHYLTVVLVDYDACRRVAYENMLDARDEGLDYLELRFSPWFMAEAHGLDASGVTEAVLDGIEAGKRETDIPAGAIGILSRTYGEDVCMKELEALLAHQDRLVAVDLAGDEVNFPAARFRPHFDRVREAGLKVTIHAGEADGPASIRSAIEDLGADRIGHGVRCVEDPALMALLAERRIGLEVSLTSNVHTQTTVDFASHPLRQILDAGIVASLNTDDPAISGIDLRHEYAVAAPAAGLDETMTRQTQANALAMAFLDAGQRASLAAGRSRAG
ncbi:MAG: adenosine deaminase [Pseudomonadota bacterium]